MCREIANNKRLNIIFSQQQSESKHLRTTKSIYYIYTSNISLLIKISQNIETPPRTPKQLHDRKHDIKYYYW